MKLRLLILSALFAALTVLGAKISIIIPGIDLKITLQTFFVFMAGLLLEPKYALFSQLVYTALGLIGIPVFSGNSAGIGYVLQPSFGFILGFFVCTVIISATVRKNIIKYNSEKNNKLPFIAKAVSGMLLSIIVLYIFGIGYMYIIKNVYLNTPASFSLIFGSMWIFMLVDIVKFSVALPLCMAIQRRLPKSV